MPVSRLQRSLENLSEDTWERLRNVKALSIFRGNRFGEETITDIAMLDLNRQGFKRSIFVQTTKAEEALSGTDFECWLRLSDKRWMRLAIQAKRLNLYTTRYDDLGYKVAGIRQIDLLERYALHHGAVPLYCLYNYFDKVNPRSHWQCCQEPFRLDQLGCTVTPSSNVRQSLWSRGKRKFDPLHRLPNTIPWRCLAICPKIESVLSSGYLAPSIDEWQDEQDWFPVEPRIYHEVPAILRRALQDSQDQDERRAISSEELDSEQYERSVGIPKWILVWDR